MGRCLRSGRLVGYAVPWLVVWLGGLWLPAASAEPEFVGVLALALDDEIAARLKLTDRQRAQLLEIVDQREAEALELALELKDLAPPERAAKLAPFREASERRGLAILDDDQRRQLEALCLERAGMSSLAEPQVAQRLKLTSDQQAQIADLLAQRGGNLAKVDGEARRVVRADYERKLAAVLNDQQRALWEHLAGVNTSDAAGAAPPVEDDRVAQPRQTTFPPDNDREERAAETTRSPAAAGASGDADADSSPPEADGRLRFNFRYQPWPDVLDWFAERAGLSLVMDAPPTGTFNYTDSRYYTPAEAIDLLNGVLLTKGYTLVRRERMVMLVNLEDGIPPNLVPQVALADLDEKGEFELVSVLFALERMTTDEADQEISKLIGPQGSVVKLAKARQIVVTETAGRLRTIRSVIQAIEDPDGAAAGALRVFQLEQTPLESADAIVRQLLDIPADRNTTSDGTIRLALDPARNQLLVRGQPDKLARVAEILEVIDPAGAGGAAVARLAEAPQLEVYAIASADPAAVLEVLQTLLTGLPDVRLASDPKTGNLVALARPAQQATIRATIAQLERDGQRVEVMRLARVDPQLAVLAINKLFGADAAGGGARAPKVDAEPTTRQLLVRGSEAQIAEIRALLEKMGESDATASAPTTRGNLRMLPLTGRAARHALEQIEQVWPTLYDNKIRVVTPSAASPALRSGSEPGSDLSGRRFDLPGRLDPLPRREPAGDTSPAGPPSSPDADQPDEEQDAAEPQPDPEETTERAAPRVRFHLARERREAGADHFAGGPQRTGSAPAEPRSDGRPDELGPGGARTAQDASAPGGADSAPSADENGEPQSPGPSREPAPIIVVPGPGGIMIACEDPRALDAFEALLAELAGAQLSGGTQFTVFYLKSASASVVAETLGQILGGGAAARSGSAGGSLLGDIAGAALGEAGGGIMGTLLGLGGGRDSTSETGAVVARGSIVIVPDLRLNALVVQARPNDLDTIEQLLEVLDQQDTPDTLVAPKPRLIPVLHTKAADIADVLRQVYQDRLVANPNVPRQPSPEEFFRMLRGGRGGQSPSGRGPPAETEKMSIGVDERTNSLVISAPQPLFEEVEQLVATLDLVTDDTTQAVRVVTLRRTNTQAVQQALAAMVGDAVRTNGTSGRDRPGSDSSPRFGPAGPADLRTPEQMEEFRRRMEFFNNLQRFRGGRGFGGERGFGGFGGEGRDGRSESNPRPQRDR